MTKEGEEKKAQEWSLRSTDTKEGTERETEKEQLEQRVTNEDNVVSLEGSGASVQ